MPLKERFSQQLRYLRELGNEFAEDDPRLKHLLGSEGSDPDVQRLIEGFAFLTARVAQKVEDHLPEITHPLLQLVYPNALRPLPSVTMVRFDPITHALSGSQVIPKGTHLFSRPVDGVNCSFRTCSEVTVQPLVIGAIHASQGTEKSMIRIDFNALSDQPLRQMQCDRLSFYLGGECSSALTLYQWLSQRLCKIYLRMNEYRYALPTSALDFAGFDPREALLPNPGDSFDGYRLLQEYFWFPKRFRGVSLTGLRSLWPNARAEHIQLELHFDAPLPHHVQLDEQAFCLYCTPAVNLFSHPARSIQLAGQAICEAVKPAGLRPAAYDIFSVDKVGARRRDLESSLDEQWLEFKPFESLQHPVEVSAQQRTPYYSVTLEQGLINQRTCHLISLQHADKTPYLGNREDVSIELTCSNGDLPTQLGEGELNVTSQATPSFATYRNLARPTRSYPPALDAESQWALISNLALNNLSLNASEALKTVLRVYDPIAPHDLQHKHATTARLNGIEHASTAPLDWMIKGLPVRGNRTTLKVNPDAFASEGEMQLFGTVLSHFMALYASSHSFHQLEIINTVRGTCFTWPARTGKQPAI